MMRPLVLAGLVLAIVGAFVLFRGLTYTSERDVVRIGPVEASLEEKKSVPPWIGGIVLAAGVGLIVAGARRK